MSSGLVAAVLEIRPVFLRAFAPHAPDLDSGSCVSRRPIPPKAVSLDARSPWAILTRRMRPVLFHIPLGFANLPLYSYGRDAGAVAHRRLVPHARAVRARRHGPRDHGPLLRVDRGVRASPARACSYVLTNLDRFDNFFDIFKVWQGGLVAYGGFLGGFVGALVFCRVKGIRLLAWADCAVPSLCTGLMITRIGCLLYGCDFGKPFDGKWSIVFPAGSPRVQPAARRGAVAAVGDCTRCRCIRRSSTSRSTGSSCSACSCWCGAIASSRARCSWPSPWATRCLRYYVETLRADEQRGNVGPLVDVAVHRRDHVPRGRGAAWRTCIARYRKNPHAMQLWTDGQALVTAGPAVPDGAGAGEAQRQRRTAPPQEALVTERDRLAHRIRWCAPNADSTPSARSDRGRSSDRGRRRASRCRRRAFLTFPTRKRTVCGADEPLDVARLDALPEGKPVRVTVKAPRAARRVDRVLRRHARRLLARARRRQGERAVDGVPARRLRGRLGRTAASAFVCPCHDSRFALDGVRAVGPARRGRSTRSTSTSRTARICASRWRAASTTATLEEASRC